MRRACSRRSLLFGARGGIAWIAATLVLAPACRCQKRKPPLEGPAEWIADRIEGAGDGFRIHAIAGSGRDDVWAVGDGIHHWDGTSWKAAKLERACFFNALSVVSPDEAWAVGVNGCVARWDGKTWTADALPTARISENPAVAGYFDLLQVVAWPDEVWVSDAGPHFHRFDGKTWTKEPLSLPSWGVQEFWGSGPRDVWLAGGWAPHFDGTKWEKPLSPIVAHGIHGSGPNDVWFVGWKGDARNDVGAAAHFDGALHEVPVPTGTPVLWDVWSVDANEAYAVGGSGWAIRWDGGAWHPSATGVKGLLRAVYSPGKGAAFAGGVIGPYILRRTK